MKKSHNNLPQTTADLVGKTWLRKGTNVKVLSVSEDGLELQTKIGPVKFKNRLEASHWLAECLPVSEDFAPAKASGIQSLIIADKEGDDVVGRLMGGLLADFEKLEKDPGYVGQAKQRSNQVNTMMNVVKTQLQLQKNNQ